MQSRVLGVDPSAWVPGRRSETADRRIGDLSSVQDVWRPWQGVARCDGLPRQFERCAVRNAGGGEPGLTACVAEVGPRGQGGVGAVTANRLIRIPAPTPVPRTIFLVPIFLSWCVRVVQRRAFH